ncbi:MAG TPA: sugar ABC transporter substrate-binding protein [Gaiellaceae bacterium]
MSRRPSSSRARVVGAALAVLAVVTSVLVISVSTATGTPTAKKPVTIALFVAIQANPVEQAIINNVKAVAKADGAVKVDVFDSNNSVPKEIANCNDAIASGKYDAFALKAVAGPPLMNCARKALKAGIPVVAFGNALGPNPNTAARQIPGLSASVIELARINGQAVANLAAAACKAKGANPCNVIYTYGPLAFDWASLSRKYFMSTVKAKYPNIKVIATGLNNFDPNAARTLTKSLVQTHSNVDVIASDGDLGAMGVIAGLKDLGKTPGKDVLVTGGAISKQGAGLIKSGAMFGSTCLMPATEAKTAAKLTILAARKQRIARPDVEVCAVFSPTGNAPITKANLPKFHPEW